MKKKIIINTLMVLVFVMIIGYSVFSTSLKINGTANIASTWNVVFTNITEVSKTSGVAVVKTPTVSGTTANFDVSFKQPGDKIVYEITVENKGTLNAVVNDINAQEDDSDAISFEILNINIGDKLAKSSSIKFKIQISYDESITTQPNILTNKLTVNINFVQDVGQTITTQPTFVVNEYGYVASNLFVLFDGIQNSSSGHVSTATSWKDLSGFNNDGTIIKGSGSWEANGLVFDGTNTGVYLDDKLKNLFKTSNTIEIRIKFSEAGRDVIFGNYPEASGNVNYEKQAGAGNIRSYVSYGTLLDYSHQYSLSTNQDMTLTFVFNKENSKIDVYVNGVFHSSAIDNVISKFNADYLGAYIGRDGRTGETVLKGKVYSFRTYTRILTTSEILNNYQTDISRFK